MAKAFPTDDPYLNGYFAPLTMECDAPDLPVIGEFPAALCGTLYRNGSNPQFAPRSRYHLFLGDGMLHAFRIENGRIAYRNRWVRTPLWELEHSTGEALSGEMYLGKPHTADPRALELNSTLANTHVVWHGHRLLALEEMHGAFEVDPQTLMPLGYQRFGGKLEGPMTAHPKIDPVNGEMISFGYSTGGPLTADMRLDVIDRDGKLLRSEHFMAPFPSMVHDFVVTQSHIIFPIFPLTGSMDRAQRGLPAYAWEPDRGTHVGIMPRNGTVADLRWFQGNPSYVYHPMNAFDAEDGSVVCDMVQYPNAPLFPRADGRPVAEREPEPQLVRWTFDMSGAGSGFREKVLCDAVSEFPRIDDRFATLPYRHGFLTVGGSIAGRKRGGLTHVDVTTGQLSTWMPEIGDHCGEPVFVERGIAAAEGDGWLLSVIYRGGTRTSELAVFDAGDVAAGPIGRALLSHRVPMGFHGSWVSH